MCKKNNFFFLYFLNVLNLTQFFFFIFGLFNMSIYFSSNIYFNFILL